MNKLGGLGALVLVLAAAIRWAHGDATWAEIAGVLMVTVPIVAAILKVKEGGS